MCRRFWSESLNERNRMEDLDIGEMIILRVSALPQHGRPAHAHCRTAM